MDAHLNEPEPDIFDFWDWYALGFHYDPEALDKELYNGIMTGQLTPDMDEAPVIGTHEGFLIQSAA